MSKEIPRLFCTEMIQALNRKDNPKIMTRRLDGLGEINKNPDDWEFKGIIPNKKLFVFYNGKKRILLIKCPYGVGDILCPKETWAVDIKFNKYPPREIIKKNMTIPDIIYKADGGNDFEEKQWVGKWRSGMFQPKWAWRNKRVITRVRVESLQKITYKDVLAEGYPLPEKNPNWNEKTYALDWYQTLWDKLNSAKGYEWAKNNWVFVIEFRKI